MWSQRSRIFSYPSEVVLLILNVSFFLHYVNGNEQIITVPFPNGTNVTGYPDEELVQLRMEGAKTEEVDLY